MTSGRTLEPLSKAKRSLLADLARRGGREKHGLFLLEGPRAIEDAIGRGVALSFLVVDASAEGEVGRWLAEGRLPGSVDLYRAGKGVVERLADTTTPQGILAVGRMPAAGLDALPADPGRITLLADGVQNPGNLGTLLRTLAAVGGRAAICSTGTVDPFNPKVLRGSAGAALSLAIARGVEREAATAWCQERGVAIVALAAGREDLFTARPPAGPLALVVGNEAAGLSPEIERAASLVVGIPMEPWVDSLSAAVAGSVALYALAHDLSAEVADDERGRQGCVDGVRRADGRGVRLRRAARGRGAGAPRARDLGIEVGYLQPGPLGAITDVPGVLVGHVTLVEGDSIRTGVTAIRPHPGDVFSDKVPAAIHIANGFGKLTGISQVEELGTIETPIVLTNTLAVGRAADAVARWTLDHTRSEGVRSINPVVGETNDAYLNAIRTPRVGLAEVQAAIDGAAGGPVAEGSVGAGTGTSAFDFKGGIGTASRRIRIGDATYTLGVLVQSNFGGVLEIRGVPIGRELGGADYIRRWMPAGGRRLRRDGRARRCRLAPRARARRRRRIDHDRRRDRRSRRRARAPPDRLPRSLRNRADGRLFVPTGRATT